MSTSLSAYRKVQLDSFVYVLSIYRKPPVHRTVSYQNSSAVKVTSVKGQLPDFFLSSGKEFQHFLEHNYTESYQIGSFRPGLPATFSNIPHLSVLCLFSLLFLSVGCADASNAHKKHVLRAYMKSLPRRGLESSE